MAADVADAELAVARLDARARALADTEALAHMLLRSESLASSWIEGLEIRPLRLLRAAAERRLGDESRDLTAVEVLANVEALRFGIEAVHEGTDIGIDLLLEMHRRLLSPTALAAHAGRFRTVQNWIGDSSYDPCNAIFVPPPPELVESLMKDLCAFCNADDLPTIAQAAMAHAQFETIHPFADGNGRIGRALIHLVLRKRGLSKRTLPPISLILARSRDDYFAALRSTAYVGDPDSLAARESANRWVERFAVAARQAATDADDFEQRINDLEAQWRNRLGRVRAGSTVDLLLRRLPEAPILTIHGAAELVCRTFEAANNAVAVLVDANILKPATVARRNRAFEVPELIAAFTGFERLVSS
ncbi:MAG TPA: Fic family protein [Candidatus Cybelea sp.]|nr:Fic family protein [Candidatus Cybelea sp.]